MTNNADQASDAKRCSEFLAEDSIVQTPGVTRDREDYLEYVAQLEFKIRIPGA